MNTVPRFRITCHRPVFADGMLDIIIVEDDPYYFLQLAPYSAKSDRASSRVGPAESDKWLSGLSPSYLK